MTVKTIRQARHEALEQEMHRDPRVIVIGEDVAASVVPTTVATNSNSISGKLRA